MLGSSLGTVENGEFNETNMTSFGEADPSVPESEAFFTGKPMLHGMGYAFLFRNYKPETGKWMSADPLGYPDGWNNLAYCGNWVTSCYDWLGAVIQTDAIGWDPYNPDWESNVGDVLTYLSSSTTEIECKYGEATWKGSIKKMIDTMAAASYVVEINEIDSLDGGGVQDWPNTQSGGGNADIYIDNTSYTDAYVDTNKDGLPDDRSFAEALLWELMNAFARTELGASEATFTIPNYEALKNTLRATGNPFPFRNSPRLYRITKTTFVVE